MEDKLEKLLISLNSEIDYKCMEIKKEKQERRNIRLFISLCCMFVCFPVVLFLAGVNIAAAALPVIVFLAVNIFFLAPVILNEDMGGAVE